MTIFIFVDRWFCNLPAFNYTDTLFAQFQQSFSEPTPLWKLGTQVDMAHQREHGVSRHSGADLIAGELHELFCQCRFPIRQRLWIAESA